MGRSSEDVSDPSPLGSPHIDLPARAGWLVRTTRLHHLEGPRLLGEVAGALGVSPGTLSRWETGQSRMGNEHLERLETGLRTRPGALRGPVAVLHRMLGVLPPRIPLWREGGPQRDLAVTSARVRAVFEGGARGLDWMHLADAVEQEQLLVPVSVIDPVLRSLVSEYGRSVTGAYFCRDDTMVRLVQGPYGRRLREILLETALQDDTQVRVDLLGATGHCPTPELFTRMCALLGDERDQVFRGAAWSIETMFRQRVLAVLPLLPDLERALRTLPAARRAQGVALLASLPHGVRRALGPALGPALASLAPPRGLAGLGAPEQRAVARAVGRAVAAALGTSLDPMVERLVREALFDTYWTKRLSARFLLTATPYASVVGDCVARSLAGVDRVEEDPLGTAALDFVTSTSSAEGLAVATAWARDARGAVRERGLVALAHHGHDLDPDLLDGAVRVGGTVTERALYAAGMTGSPVLSAWRDRAAPDSEIGLGAAWWLRHGARVED